MQRLLIVWILILTILAGTPFPQGRVTGLQLPSHPIAFQKKADCARVAALNNMRLEPVGYRAVCIRAD